MAGAPNTGTQLTQPYLDRLHADGDFVFVFAPDGTVLFTGPGLCRLAGGAHAPTPDTLFAPQDAAWVRNGIARAFAGDFLRMDCELASGPQSVPVQLCFVSLDGAAPPKDAVALLVRDLSDFRAAHRETARALGVLGNVLNSMDAAVFVSDPETDEILFANRRFVESKGGQEKVVGRICRQVLHHNSNKRCKNCPKEILLHKPDERVVREEYDAKTGRSFKNVDALIDWTGAKKVHMSYSVDVTDLMEAQRDTLDVRRRLEAALAASNAGVWELDVENGLVMFDDLCARLFCYGPRGGILPLDVIVRHMESVLTLSAPGIMRAELLRRSDSGLPIVRDVQVNLENGEKRYVRCYTSAALDDSGELAHIIGMSIDVTAQDAMERDLSAAKQAAEEANQAKTSFLTSMSHEIRTPMNAIIGITELLLADEMPGRQRKYVTDIRTSADVLLKLVNGILDFSRIEAGRLQLSPVSYDIYDLLDNLRSMFEPVASKKGVGFFVDIEPGLPRCLFGDDIRIRQILINTIGNALKFTAEGHVRLRAGHDAQWLIFDVEDTGQGIRKEDLPKLFDNFMQFDTKTNRSTGGTGLGLSITRSLVKMMYGAIHVDSEYGKGSRFHIELPLVGGDEDCLTQKPAAEKLVSAPDAKVLVVDDNEINLNVASGLLRLFGITCETAQSGVSAIEMARTRQYDLILMDHMMPEMDGVETVLRIRALGGHNAGVPVAALTANATEGAREFLLKSGMDDYLSKPIDTHQLNVVLKKQLPQEKLQEASHEPQALPAPPEEQRPGFLQILRGPGGALDIPLALSRLGGMENVLEDSLSMLANRLPEMCERLERHCGAGDIAAFAVEVHGAKGSLANVGATRLAEEAQALEDNAKNDNGSFFEQHLPAFLDGLHALAGEISGAVAQRETGSMPRPPGDLSALPAKLADIRLLLDAFECDDAAALIRQTLACDYGEAVDRMLRDLLRKTEEFDFENAIRLIDQLL